MGKEQSVFDVIKEPMRMNITWTQRLDMWFGMFLYFVTPTTRR
jgi:hypothetical protein